MFTILNCSTIYLGRIINFNKNSKVIYWGFKSSPFGCWFPLSCISVKSFLFILQKSRVDRCDSRSILSESRKRCFPLMGPFKEWILEILTVRKWYIIILMMNPSMPFRWNSIPIRTSYGKIIIIFDPSSLIIILINKILR